MTDAIQHEPARRRPAAYAATLVAIAVLAVALAPERRLRCAEPWLEAHSPDRAWTLTVCRRPMLMAMPGGSSDAPGWIVLRDGEGAIRGVVHLEMMQLLGDNGAVAAVRWEAGRVVLPDLAQMPLVPASGRFMRWFDDRIWRLRALCGLMTADEMSSQG